MIKTSIVRKVDGKYILYSRKKNPKTGKRRILGKADSLKKIKEREKQVQFFKGHHADDHEMDKKDKSLTNLSEIAQYLEEAGFIEDADHIYNCMYLLDNSLSDEDYLYDHHIDSQLNIENEGTIPEQGVGGSGMFSMMEAQRLAFLKLLVKTADDFDKKDLKNEADELDKILKDFVEEYEDANVDMMVGANGLQGSSVLDNQGAGQFSGLSDSYFYRSYENDEGVYEHEENPQKLTL